MIRIVCRDTDVGAAVNVGGPVNLTYKTFDVELPAVEEWLREPIAYRREVIAVEILVEARDAD